MSLYSRGKECFNNCTKFTFEFFCEYINFEYSMKDMADKNIPEKKKKFGKLYV